MIRRKMTAMDNKIPLAPVDELLDTEKVSVSKCDNPLVPAESKLLFTFGILYLILKT
jgi:hypothetical protein